MFDVQSTLIKRSAYTICLLLGLSLTAQAEPIDYLNLECDAATMQHRTTPQDKHTLRKAIAKCNKARATTLTNRNLWGDPPTEPAQRQAKPVSAKAPVIKQAVKQPIVKQAVAQQPKLAKPALAKPRLVQPVKIKPAKAMPTRTQPVVSKQAFAKPASPKLTKRKSLNKDTPYNVKPLVAPQQQVQTKNLISLNDVLHNVLNQSPEVAQAIATINQSEASIKLASAAYIPTINAVGEYNLERTSNYNNGFNPFFEEEGPSKSLGPSIRNINGSLNLDWLLFDWGQRGKTLSAARHRLSSAIASQENIRINRLIEALRLYTAAYNAHGQLETQIESEEIAAKSMNIAEALFDAEVAGLTEKLQAQTAKAQASLNRSVAQGNWDIARGQLAVAMGWPVSSDYSLSDESAVFKTEITPAFVNGVIDQVKNNHPNMRSLRAEIAALEETLAATKTENKGRLNFVMSGSKGSSDNFDGLGNDSETKRVSVGVRATIPLFNGKAQSAREAQIAAQIEDARARLMATRNTLLTALWQNVQQVKTTANNLINTDMLLKTAAQNYEVALGRYRQGVGSIVDLLNAQTTLATAKQRQQVQKVSHIQSHMQLTLSAGNLTGEKFDFSN